MLKSEIFEIIDPEQKKSNQSKVDKTIYRLKAENIIFRRFYHVVRLGITVRLCSKNGKSLKRRGLYCHSFSLGNKRKHNKRNA